MAVVTEYLLRILGGLPEGERPSSGVSWAEGKSVEILGTVEFKIGAKLE